MRFLIFESFIKYMHFHFFLLFQLSAKFVDFGDSLLGHVFICIHQHIFLKNQQHFLYTLYICGEKLEFHVTTSDHDQLVETMN
jgi:hypothetical protein